MPVPVSCWTEDKFREAIKNLDKKTGLNGAALKIIIGRGKRVLGSYNTKGVFRFSSDFFNSPDFLDAAKIDIIRHEYAHYYDDVVNLSFWITPVHSIHGNDFKYACLMVGADPLRVYNHTDTDRQANRDFDERDIKAAINADDVLELDIMAYIRKNGAPPKTPPPPGTAIPNSGEDISVSSWLSDDYKKRWGHDALPDRIMKQCDDRLKAKLSPDRYFSAGDRVELKGLGLGTILETDPFFTTQYACIVFDSGRILILDCDRISKFNPAKK
jgi:hypothetical protein